MRDIAKNHPGADLPEGTYVELVKSLFLTLLSTSIMSIAFISVGLLINFETPDHILAILTGLGLIASLVRIAVLLHYRRWANEETLDGPRARRTERRFAIAYFGFAAILGMFGFRAFEIAAPRADMLIIGLLVGYGAGVAAGLSLRPWISVPSMVLAIFPTIVAAALTPDITCRAAGILLTALTAGGISSMLSRYRSETRKITMRRMFATLARNDHLTGLPNRLSLSERFDALQGRDGGKSIAVHCLDLDRFKPINDRYGHPTGDALLQAVAKRLGSLLRQSDFAARLGGDEFIIIQTGIRHRGEAEMLARRVVRAIAEPYAIEGRSLTISTSIGYSLSADCGSDLEVLMARADEALCQTKHAGIGTVAYGECDPQPENRLTA